MALVGIIGIVVISSFSLGYISSIFVNTPIDDTPKIFIATDDTYLYGIGNDDKPQGNETFIMGGSREAGFIRFNLTERPEEWEKVEISLYKFESNGESSFRGVVIDFFESDWNESMTLWEVRNAFIYRYWYASIRSNDDYLTKDLGLQMIDITKYIKNNESFSVRLSGGIGGTGYAKMYSKEADVNRTWLPQLVWS